jgi:hypothetical protein
MAGYGQLDVERRTLEGMTPEEQEALIRGEYMPERLAEFRATRDAEQQRLQGQLDRVHRSVDQPINVRGNNTALQMGALAANALRQFGGMYMAGQKEKQMADAQTASAAQFQDLMKRYGEDATGAGLSTKRRGLSDALRSFSGDGGYSL